MNISVCGYVYIYIHIYIYIYLHIDVQPHMYVCIVDVSDGLHPWVVLAGASASCSSSPFALALALAGQRDHSWVSRASSSSISVACGRITIHTYQVNACMIHNVFKFLWIAWAQTGHQPVEVQVGDVRTVRVELVEDGIELVGVLINTWLWVCVCAFHCEVCVRDGVTCFITRTPPYRPSWTSSPSNSCCVLSPSSSPSPLGRCTTSRPHSSRVAPDDICYVMDAYS